MEQDLIELKSLVDSLPPNDLLKTLDDLEQNDQAAALDLIRARGEHDLEFFCEIFFPHYCAYPFNQFHRDSFEDYKSDVRAVKDVGIAPRGYAKSTVKVLFKPVHDVCYKKEKFTVVISSNEAQAIGKLKDIRRELLNNDLLVDVFGIEFPRKNPGETSFIVSNGEHETLFLAVGSGTEIRGLRFGESRPTKIILDDVEDTEEVQNPDLRAKIRDWYFEVVRQLGSNYTNIEIVGTVLHRDSLLKKLEKNPAYKTRLYRAVISWAENQKLWQQWTKIYTDMDRANREGEADAFFAANSQEMLKGSQVLWPEKESYYYLMKEMIEVGRKSFMKEKQNDPTSDEDALFDSIWWYSEDEARGGFIIEKTGAFVPYEQIIETIGAMDPATGDSKKDSSRIDYTCMVGGKIDTKGRLFVHRDWTKVAKPSSYTKELFNLHEELNFERFGVEMNLYRNLLMENLVRERKEREAERKRTGVAQWGLKIPFYEIESRDKKEKRIFTLEPKVNHGWILFNRTLSVEFINQVQGYPKEDHDDAPDALEMLWGMANNKYKASAISVNAMGAR